MYHSLLYLKSFYRISQNLWKLYLTLFIYSSSPSRSLSLPHVCFVSFMWIPTHIGIPGNESVDQAAKSALTLPRLFHTFLLTSNLRSFFRQLVLRKWQRSWKPTRTSLCLIKSTVFPWLFSTSLSVLKNQYCTVFKLHIHYSLIPIYSSIYPPLECPFCYAERVTVSHLFDCQFLYPSA